MAEKKPRKAKEPERPGGRPAPIKLPKKAISKGFDPAPELVTEIPKRD